MLFFVFSNTVLKNNFQKQEPNRPLCSIFLASLYDVNATLHSCMNVTALLKIVFCSLYNWISLLLLISSVSLILSFHFCHIN